VPQPSNPAAGASVDRLMQRSDPEPPTRRAPGAIHDVVNVALNAVRNLANRRNSLFLGIALAGQRLHQKQAHKYQADCNRGSRNGRTFEKLSARPAGATLGSIAMRPAVNGSRSAPARDSPPHLRNK